MHLNIVIIELHIVDVNIDDSSLVYRIPRVSLIRFIR